VDAVKPSADCSAKYPDIVAADDLPDLFGTPTEASAVLHIHCRRESFGRPCPQRVDSSSRETLVNDRAKEMCKNLCRCRTKFRRQTCANNHAAEAMTVRAVILDLSRAFGVTTNQFV
jgi:hypothetical protein